MGCGTGSASEGQVTQDLNRQCMHMQEQPMWLLGRVVGWGE